MNESVHGLIRQRIVAIFLLVVSAWVPFSQAAPFDRSDLNNDYTVDTLDLEIFSNEHLAQGWETVDWCHFYTASISNERYFRKYTSDKTERFGRLLNFIASSYNCQVTAQSISESADKSDLNDDLIVDLSDLVIFSTNYLETFWEAVDWCLFYESTVTGAEFEGRSTKYYLKHFQLLLAFINDYFNCDGSGLPPIGLQLENVPKFLARIAGNANFTGDYYISDPIVGSLFIYDANLVLKFEIKALSRPLGVAIDTQGYILIGNDGRDNIEVYDPANGELVAVFGEGLVKMPTAITVDTLGNIYVTDSRSNSIQVFDPAYNPVRVIGKDSAQGALNFPVDTEFVTRSGDGVGNIQEIFVADQANKRVQVYDLEGNWLRSITFLGADCNWFTNVCASPPFTRLQALDVDSFGRLQVLDNFAASVMMFDPGDGAFLGAYGGYGTDGTEPGSLRVPMDVLISDTNMAIVTTGDGDRIEVFTIP